MKMLNKMTILAVSLGASACLQTAQASLTSTSYSLSDLSQGGSITLGDKTFSNFGFQLSGDSLTSFDPTSISVYASVDNNGVYYLNWNGSISYQGSGIADILLQYEVTANAGMIDMIDQSYTGSGNLRIDETVAAGDFGGPILAQSDLTGTFNSDFTGENLLVNPAQTSLYVTKDISLGSQGEVTYDTISRVSQSFHQTTAVPEPSTVVAGALLLLPFGVSTIRILRKSKAS